MAVYATEGLLEVLIEFAADREPEEANVPIAATPAGELTGLDSQLADLAPGTPVLTHFYLPDAAGSVTAVFGVDLGTPSGGAQARFVSHPTGPRAVTKTDDLAGVVLVAVPPWEVRTVTAFDRNGTELELRRLDAEPPVERIE
ncbi:hypothetical protein [Halohasta litorea]|uniref:Proteasome lid subunit RPN8/RPN11, contains Jab1/MPN metalloenzyme (JAMM) motif n=1 Tax=Halohasta litorea TaxID=869891 RepID=A0ABD6D7I5_9EURY|nr:hypothetical protein [Halohasta litorea]MEA1931594.1 hypothetical protein [Euryarchaeota archaeon]